MTEIEGKVPALVQKSYARDIRAHVRKRFDTNDLSRFPRRGRSVDLASNYYRFIKADARSKVDEIYNASAHGHGKMTPMEGATTGGRYLSRVRISAFVRKHYYGDYTLGRSFWVNLILAQFVLGTLLTISFQWLGALDLKPQYSSACALSAFALNIAGWFWSIRGTLASSTKHVDRGGKTVWVVAARASIALNAAVVLATAVGRLDELGEHLLVALGEQPGPDLVVQVRADGRSMLLNGGINDGAAEALRKALDLAPAVDTIVLASVGGWTGEGEKLARLISERRLNTYVESECSSACTIAFLGGAQRAAEPNARIGFHSARPVGGFTSENRVAVERDTESIYLRAGVAPAFVARMLKTPSDQVWYPSQTEMMDAGVLTRRSLGGETATIATAFATALPAREALATKLLEGPVWSALKERYPEVFDAAVDDLWSTVVAGGTDAEVLDSSRKKWRLW